MPARSNTARKQCILCSDPWIRRKMELYVQEKMHLTDILTNLRKDLPNNPNVQKITLEQILEHVYHMGTQAYYLLEEYTNAKKMAQLVNMHRKQQAGKKKYVKEAYGYLDKIEGLDYALQDYKTILDRLLYKGSHVAEVLSDDVVSSPQGKKQVYAKGLAPLMRALKEMIAVGARLAEKLHGEGEEGITSDNLLDVLKEIKQTEEKAEETAIAEEEEKKLKEEVLVEMEGKDGIEENKENE